MRPRRTSRQSGARGPTGAAPTGRTPARTGPHVSSRHASRHMLAKHLYTVLLLQQADSCTGRDQAWWAYNPDNG